MSTAAERSVARAVNPLFTAMRQQARAGKTRYGDWISRLSNALLGPLSGTVLAGLRSSGISGMTRAARASLGQDGEAAARARALQVAREILAVTSEWLEEGRELEEVFGRDRVARIALTEAKHAQEMGFALGVQATGGRIEWEIDADACPECRSLNGRRVKPGGWFRSKSGTRVQHPPLHPNCSCRLKRG